MTRTKRGALVFVFSIAIAGAVSVPVFGQDAPDEGKSLRIRRAALRVRSAPDAGERLVTWLFPGESYRVLEQNVSADGTLTWLRLDVGGVESAWTSLTVVPALEARKPELAKLIRVEIPDGNASRSIVIDTNESPASVFPVGVGWLPDGAEKVMPLLVITRKGVDTIANPSGGAVAGVVIAASNQALTHRVRIVPVSEPAVTVTTSFEETEDGGSRILFDITCAREVTLMGLATQVTLLVPAALFPLRCATNVKFFASLPMPVGRSRSADASTIVGHLRYTAASEDAADVEWSVVVPEAKPFFVFPAAVAGVAFAAVVVLMFLAFGRSRRHPKGTYGPPPGGPGGRRRAPGLTLAEATQLSEQQAQRLAQEVRNAEKLTLQRLSELGESLKRVEAYGEKDRRALTDRIDEARLRSDELGAQLEGIEKHFASLGQGERRTLVELADTLEAFGRKAYDLGLAADGVRFQDRSANTRARQILDSHFHTVSLPTLRICVDASRDFAAHGRSALHALVEKTGGGRVVSPAEARVKLVELVFETCVSGRWDHTLRGLQQFTHFDKIMPLDPGDAASHREHGQRMIQIVTDANALLQAMGIRPLEIRYLEHLSEAVQSMVTFERDEKANQFFPHITLDQTHVGVVLDVTRWGYLTESNHLWAGDRARVIRNS